MDLLPAELTSLVTRTELLARMGKEGSLTGKHSSPQKGSSVEFAEHRPYVPGDDIRNLDWRAFAKSDRYYVKQYMDETNLRATILVDASGSMNFQGHHASSLQGKKLTKFAYAQHLAAMLAYLLIGQQDAVGLVTFDDRVRTEIRPLARPSQLRSMLQALQSTSPGSDTAAARVFHDIAERIPRRCLLILISDLFDEPAAIRRALHHFQHRHHELIVFHLMAEEELTFPFRRFTTFRDLEGSHRQVRVDPLALRSQYLQKVQEFLQMMERVCGQMQADYVRVNTSENLPAMLSNYLSSRKT